MNTVATFKSNSFNTTIQKEYFINPNCYGDDLCKYIIKKMQDKNIKVDLDPIQEDYGWQINYTDGKDNYICVIGYRPKDNDGQEGVWIVWVEKRVGIVGALLGNKHKNISNEAILPIHRILTESKEIFYIKWHDKYDFDKGNEENYKNNP